MLKAHVAFVAAGGGGARSALNWLVIGMANQDDGLDSRIRAEEKKLAKIREMMGLVIAEFSPFHTQRGGREMAVVCSHLTFSATSQVNAPRCSLSGLIFYPFSRCNSRPYSLRLRSPPAVCPRPPLRDFATMSLGELISPDFLILNQLKQDTDELRVMYCEGPHGSPFYNILA